MILSATLPYGRVSVGGFMESLFNRFNARALHRLEQQNNRIEPRNKEKDKERESKKQILEHLEAEELSGIFPEFSRCGA